MAYFFYFESVFTTEFEQDFCAFRILFKILDIIHEKISACINNGNQNWPKNGIHTYTHYSSIASNANMQFMFKSSNNRYSNIKMNETSDQTDMNVVQYELKLKGNRNESYPARRCCYHRGEKKSSQ